MDMKEQEFDDLLTIDEQADFEEEKKLHKQLNRQVLKRTIIMLLSCIVLIASCLFGVSKIMDAYYYNPTKKGSITKTSITDFDYLMYIATSLAYPDIEYIAINQGQSHGFGHYTHYAQIQKIYKPLVISGSHNIVFDIKRNYLSIQQQDSSSGYTIYQNRFSDFKHLHDGYQQDQVNEEMIQEIKSLPDSTRIEISISFPYKTLDEVVSFIDEYKNSNFHWIAIVNPEDEYAIPTGISLSSFTRHELSKEINETYPSLTLDEENLTSDILMESYLSKLQLLSDHKEFLNTTQSFFPWDFDQVLQYAKTKNIEAMGVYGQLTKKDMLSLMEKHPDYLLNIEDVIFSIYDTQ